MRASSSRAVFDLGHMARLSYDPGLVLVVSERTSYILHNLAIADVRDSNRYAIYPPFDGWYQPVQPSDGPEYGVFEQIVRDFERDVLEVGTLPIPIYPITGVDSEVLADTADAAAFYLYTASVPSGEAWEVENVRLIATTAITLGQVDAINQSLYIMRVISPAPSVEQYLSGRWTLGEGAYLRFTYLGCTPGVTVCIASISYRIIPVESV